MNRSAHGAAIALVSLVAMAPGMIGAQNRDAVAFNAVSIKRHVGGGPSQAAPTPSGYLATNVPFFILIPLAYPVRMSDQVIGAPDWFYDEPYDVDARYTASPSPDERTALWRNLFAERLKVRARLEQRVRDTFSLVLARAGRISPSLKKTDVDCSAAAAAPDCTTLARGLLTTRGLSMADLARIIQPMPGEPYTTGAD